MDTAFRKEWLAIFLAVLAAEIVVLAAQAWFPMLAERVRVQQEAWGSFPFGQAQQVSEQDAAA